MRQNSNTIALLFILTVFSVVAGAKLLGAFPSIPNPGGKTSDGAVNWNLKLSHPYVEKGSDREVLMNMVITGREAGNIERPPVNLVLVIDRSGSMSEKGKIEYAREAAAQIIKSLGPNDRLSVVAYSTDVELLYPIQFLKDKQFALSVVSSLYPTDSTNLSGGLTTGISQLETLDMEGYVNRVILLSDGLANAGITDMGQLNRIASDAAEKGVHVTTMGLGLSYDENLMMSLAEYGAGNYYFIESPTQLASIFNREFGEIAATVAKDPAITLALAPGVKVKDVYGYTYDTPEDGKVLIKLGDFFGGQERDILIRLEAPAEVTGERLLAKASIRYDDLLENVSGAVMEKSLSYNVTEDKAKVAANEEKGVIVRGVSVDSAQNFYRATTSYEKGDRDQAISQLRQAYDSIAEINKTSAATAETMEQERELRDALGQISAPNAPSPTSEDGKRLIKQNKADARQQQK